MKKLIIITFFILFSIPGSFHAHAQSYADPASGDTVHYPYWVQMMQDPDAPFHATRSAFEKYWAGRTDYKGNGWKVFKRWEYLNQDLVQADGKLPQPGSTLQEYEKYKTSHPVLSPSGNWNVVGPVSLPVNNTSQPNGMGRINSIAFDPVSSTTFYIGSPSGGLWKTTDGGSTWTVLISNLPTLGVSSILIHPANTSQILIGTGDRDAGDAPGMGVYKSTDGGSTWTVSNSGMGNLVVGMMIRLPSDPNIILATTSGGIYKSADGGATWTRKSSNTNHYKDIKFNPGDPTIVYATENGKFYRSTNTGDTWTQITSGIIAGNRLVIGVSPNQPATVYLLMTNGPFAGLLRSTNSGLSFTTQSTTPNIMDYSCNGTGNSSQAWYDLCIAVDQSNANTIYTGGINIWKSTNAGVSWTINSHWVGSSWGYGCAPSVHADIHTLDWSPLTGNLYTGCDGGIYTTSNGGANWTDLSSGLAIAQVYKIGQSATNQGLVNNGYQDNGSATGHGYSFNTIIGGDGMECLIDYSDTNYRYGEIYYGSIYRSSGYGYGGITGGISESGPWVTPYILHVTNPSTMFVGDNNVWRTTNVKAGSVSWTAISSGEVNACGVLEQSPADPNILYVSRGSVLKRTDNADAGSVAWSTCTSPGGSNITDLAAHPTDANTVYATAGTKVYKSINKGSTWTDISGTLPATSINCIVYDKNVNEGLYIGNKTAVFYRDASMSDWIAFSTGLPVVNVRELEIFYDNANPANNRIKAATYGRGLLQSDLMGFLTVTPSNQDVTSPAGTTSFAVTCNAGWAASTPAGWCTITPSGTGNGTITADYTENTTVNQRVATITVTSGSQAPQTVTVTQDGATPLLIVVPSNQYVTAPAGSTSYTVTSNTDWTVTVDSSWCTVTPAGTGNGTILANYTENLTVNSRIATITVTVSGLSPLLVTVTQAGAVPILLVDPPYQNVTEIAGSTAFSITSNTTWTASSNQTWCTVTPSGTGNGMITADYTTNAVHLSRTADITVNVSGVPPQTVAVNQDASTVSVAEHAGKSIRIYPNPTNGSFFIVPEGLGNDDLSITVLDMTERIILNREFRGDQSITMDLSGSPDGCYIIKVRTGSGVIVSRLMLEK